MSIDQNFDKNIDQNFDKNIDKTKADCAGIPLPQKF